MAKVKKTFFCNQEKKKYYEGDEYTGKRKDLGDYLEKKMVKKAPQNKSLKKEVDNK